MNELVWNNKLILNAGQIKHHIIYIKKNIPGLLPLYLTEYDHLKSYSKQHNIPTTTLVSMRNLIKIQEEIYRGQISPESNERITKSFKELVKNIQSMPPSQHKNLIESFYSQNKFSVKIILRIISLEPEYKHLSHNTIKLLFQYMKDIETAEIDSKKRSMEFEEKLNNWLRENVSTTFKTEEMIRQTGVNTSTPDVLFDEPINIKLNGAIHPVYWIDAKNYALINIPFIMKSLHKQSEKYIKEFGPGAFVFHYGIDPSIKIGDTLILDGSMI